MFGGTGVVYLRLLLLLVMSVPQAFMPLLHAHLGRDGSPAVLHLPGLERYYHPDDPGIYRSAPLPSWEGVVVRSDDGVHRKPQAGPTLAAVLPEPVPSLAEPQRPPAWQKPSQAPPSRSCRIILPRAPPA